MKPFKVLFLLMILAKPILAQDYYQDIITEKQVVEKWKLYKANKVKSVDVLSYEDDNKPTENFSCSQNVKNDFSEISTYTKSDLVREALISTYYNANGQPTKTYDTSKSYQSITEYTYNADGSIASITNTALETINNIQNVEQHLWSYDADGKPILMVKIKNGNDTSYVRFVKDEKGNIVEEHSVHNNIEEPFTYYYYDDNNRMTDIVRYNTKAKKLLPNYIFTYNENGQLSSMIFVQEGSVDYNRWAYEYDEKGLRTREVCFSKQKQLLGKIEYQYNFRK